MALILTLSMLLSLQPALVGMINIGILCAFLFFYIFLTMPHLKKAINNLLHSFLLQVLRNMAIYIHCNTRI